MKTSKKRSWFRALVSPTLIIVWLIVASLGGSYFGRMEEVAKLDLAAFLPNSAEATKVNNQIENFSKNSDNVIPAVLVFEAKNGKYLNENQKRKIKNLRKTLNAKSYLEKDAAPVIFSESDNKDKSKAALLVAPLKQSDDMKRVAPEITKVVEKELPGVTFKVTGPAGFSADIGTAFKGIDGLLLAVTLSVVFVILLIVYRSPTLPILVLATSLIALTASVLTVWNLANSGLVTLNGQVQGILFILVIGAATDYSLLYVARFKEELIRHKDRWEASKKALKASIEPIFASGGTVIAGLLCLLLSDLDSNKALGPVGAIGILFAIASALTLLPSLLLLTGRVAFWPFIPRYNPKKKELIHKKGLWGRVARLVSTYPRQIWISTVAILLLGCVGIFQLQASGASQADMVLGESAARDGQEIIGRHFAGGVGTPVQIITPTKNTKEVVETLDKHPMIDSVTIAAKDSEPGQIPIGKEERRIKKKMEAEIGKEVAKSKQEIDKQIEQQTAGMPEEFVAPIKESAYSQLPSVDKILEESYPFTNIKPTIYKNTNLLNATLTESSESNKAKEAIRDLREKLHKLDDNILIGGNTAIQVDGNNAAIHDRALIIPIILIAITAILMVLLRSIIAPLFLLVTTVLSFGTAIGISALLFNHVWQFPGADPSVILYGFVFLVALGIDYNIFLMTRVREESLKSGVKKGTLKGLVVTGGVITSAGVVLAATFAALAVIPIMFLAQLAFIVSFGVLLDTIVVRSLLVPSFILDAGKIIWWPSKKISKQ